jgi:glycine/D-amino acid oxidase-like deaminating enzyme
MAFVNRARQLGCDILENTRVTSVTTRQDRVLGVETTKGRLDSPIVIVAASNWSGELVNVFGADLPISWQREVVASFEGPYTPFVAGVDLVLGGYWRPDSQVVTLAGGGTIPPEDTVVADPGRFDSSASAEEIRHYRHSLSTRFPFMKRAVSHGGWAGIDDVTPDWLPYIGPFPGVEGLYCAFGMSSHFFKHCPAVGLAVAELIHDGKSSTFDLSNFRPSRIGEGKLTQWGYGGTTL